MSGFGTKPKCCGRIWKLKMNYSSQLASSGLGTISDIRTAGRRAIAKRKLHAAMSCANVSEDKS